MSYRVAPSTLSNIHIGVLETNLPMNSHCPRVTNSRGCFSSRFGGKCGSFNVLAVDCTHKICPRCQDTLDRGIGLKLGGQLSQLIAYHNS